MSVAAAMEAHIAYELIDDTNPDVVAIEFLHEEIVAPEEARELGQQLNSLVSPELPHEFVLDFGNVQALGSTAFDEIAAFARKVGRLYLCNIPENLRLGSDLIGQDDCACFAANRQVAIDQARFAARHGEEETRD